MEAQNATADLINQAPFLKAPKQCSCSGVQYSKYDAIGDIPDVIGPGLKHPARIEHSTWRQRR